MAILKDVVNMAPKFKWLKGSVGLGLGDSAFAVRKLGTELRKQLEVRTLQTQAQSQARDRVEFCPTFSRVCAWFL